MTTLERHSDKYLSVLQNQPGKWLTRSQIAKLAGRKKLQPHDIAALELLLMQGAIESREMPTPAPSGRRFEYRFVS